MQHKQSEALKEENDEYCSDDEQPLTASARSHDAIVADASELQRRATDAVTAAQRAANWSEKQDHDALRARHIKAARFAAEAKKKARDKANEEAELEGQKEAIRAANEADEHQQERAKTCAKLRALGLSESSGRESKSAKKIPAGKRMDTMIVSDG